MYCSECGTPVSDGASFCGNCGHPIRTAINSPVLAEEPAAVADYQQSVLVSPNQGSFETFQPILDASMTTAADGTDDFEPITPSETIQTTSLSAQEHVNGNMISEQSAAASPEVQERISSTLQSVKQAAALVKSSTGQELTPKPVNTTKKSNRQDYLSSNDLWTWLKKDERRQLFFTDDRVQLSEDEYMGLISQKLVENEVPATIEKKVIQWDNSSVKSETYIVNPSSTAVNPLSCMILFANVGRFSFVEQKTYLVPPNLPPYPGTKKPVPDKDKAGFMLYGAGCILLAILGSGFLGAVAAIPFIIGCLMIGYGYPTFMKAREIADYNDLCDRQEAKYNKAWRDWEDTVFLHAFQESTNGKISRIYQAVFESIRQVNAEQFKDIVSTDEREDTSMSELKQQISNLKESYR